jgi:hypothetical protein
MSYTALLTLDNPSKNVAKSSIAFQALFQNSVTFFVNYLIDDWAHHLPIRAAFGIHVEQ